MGSVHIPCNFIMSPPAYYK